MFADGVNHLMDEAEVTIVVGERRKFWMPWRKEPVRITVWRGYIVGYQNDSDRGASITLSDMSHVLCCVALTGGEG